MDQREAARIEKRYGKLIDTVLTEPDYRREIVGGNSVLVPYYRIRFKGQRRFIFVRAEIH